MYFLRVYFYLTGLWLRFVGVAKIGGQVSGNGDGRKMLICKLQLQQNDHQQQIGAKRLQQCQIDGGADFR